MAIALINIFNAISRLWDILLMQCCIVAVKWFSVSPQFPFCFVSEPLHGHLSCSILFSCLGPKALHEGWKMMNRHLLLAECVRIVRTLGFFVFVFLPSVGYHEGGTPVDTTHLGLQSSYARMPLKLVKVAQELPASKFVVFHWLAALRMPGKTPVIDSTSAFNLTQSLNQKTPSFHTYQWLNINSRYF